MLLNFEKILTELFLLTGNDFATSELLRLSSFCTNYKERLSTTEIQRLFIREKLLENKSKKLINFKFFTFVYLEDNY
jgi:hypothetical protein